MTVALETKVEIAFTSGFSTPEGSRVWTDVSDYTEGEQAISLDYGRADELPQPDPGRVSLTLDNRDGRFTPGNAGSPYSPNIRKGKPLRVSVRYSGGAWFVRGTWYIDEWPVVWPDGTNAASSVTISATSRRARLGRKAPLPSAIRSAYLATSPQAYWPMDDGSDVLDATGRQTFRDITNADTRRDDEPIASFYNTTALMPVTQDGTPGPTDETSLVRMPAFTDINLLSTYAHYVGAGGAIRIGAGGNLTVQAVARVTGSIDAFTYATVFSTFVSDRSQLLSFIVAADGDGDPTHAGLGPSGEYSDPDTGAFIGLVGPNLYNGPAFAAATDGEIHHYALTLSGGNTVKCYFDGALVWTGALPSPYLYNRPFINILFGSDTLNSTLWVGHGAVHDRALSDAEILVVADAATAASETLEERVKRLAGALGVPANEVDVEASIAAPLGPQAELGRAATEVLNEAAESTGGVVYDDRNGHLAMQARNHRYNSASAFTLSGVLQQINGSLTIPLDDRYLVNTVEVTHQGDEDPIVLTNQASIDDYGIYQSSITIASSNPNEAESAGLALLTRGAEPKVRVSEVSVELTSVSSTLRTSLLNADIGTRFAIAGLPSQAPADPMYLFVEGYSESISATSHSISFNTTPADVVTAWVLGDSTLSVLGTTTIPAY